MKPISNLSKLTPYELQGLYDSALFENRFAYTGTDLGAAYNTDCTEWKLWDPVAEEVNLVLYARGCAEEPGDAVLGKFAMKAGDRGVWHLALPGDCRGVYYRYEVLAGGVRTEAADPYSKACGADGERSMVVDLAGTNPDGWDEDSYCYGGRADQAIIWETHIRDFSDLPSAGSSYPGKYLAFTEENTHVPGREDLPTGIAYLKKLGITHVQLLPAFDFASVSEKEPDESYNWGYNPMNFNVPEGSYSTDPFRGEVRIAEFKQMVLALHRAGIGVVMDVVYNHTYESDKSLFHKLVPYYYHRLSPDAGDDAPAERLFANGSGCGSEIASERFMVRKYIVDSVLYWAQEYHVDGFRFDLMGLMDVDTMNAIRVGLNRISGTKHVLMYGEPWSALPPSMREGAVPADLRSLDRWEPEIGFFSDRGRDALRGSSFDLYSRGFVTGGEGLAGAVLEMGFGRPDPLRVVQYTSCHDNYTLWDKITANVPTDGSGYDSPELIRLAANKLAAAGVLLSGGTPFLMGGEEFGRTKYADGNSYRSPISVNGLDWARTDAFAELGDYYRGLIAIRKRFFALGRPDEIHPIVCADHLVGWRTRVGMFETFVILNADNCERTVTLPYGDWKLLADERIACAEPFYTVTTDAITVQPRAALIGERTVI